MKNKFRENYISHLIREKPSPESIRNLLAVLRTWSTHDPESGIFLQELLPRMSPAWWMKGREKKQKHALHENILKELIRIDGGRGYVDGWLSAIARIENDPRIFEKITEHLVKKKTEPEMIELIRNFQSRHSSTVPVHVDTCRSRAFLRTVLEDIRYFAGFAGRKQWLKKADDRLFRLICRLSNWHKETPESDEFLKQLTRQLSPETWMKMPENFQFRILLEFLRIDGERGYLVPWLTAFSRRNEPIPHFLRILSEISTWKSGEAPARDAPWKRWEQEIRSFSPGCRIMAFRLLTCAATPFSSPSRPEIADWDAQLGRLIKNCLRNEFETAVWEIIIHWQHRSGLPPSRQAQLLQEWKHKAFALEEICPTTRTTHNILPGSVRFHEKFALVWNGLTTLAARCPGGDEVVSEVMEKWFSPSVLNAYPEITDPWVLETIAGWQPRNGKLPASAMKIWSQILLTEEVEAQEIAWLVLGEKTGEGKKTEGEGVCRTVLDNCFSALQKYLSNPEILSRHPGLLFTVAPPSGLSREQKLEWQEFWIEKLTSSQPAFISLMAVVQLVRFGDPSLPNGERLRSHVLFALKKVPAGSFPHRFPQNLLGIIGKHHWGEARPWGMFNEVFDLLYFQKALTGTDGMLDWLCSKLTPLNRDEDCSFLAPPLLSVLKQEKNTCLLSRLGELWHAPAQLPEALHQMMFHIWKERAMDTSHPVRERVWHVLSPMGNEVAELLVDCLSSENSLDVLDAMSFWKPSDGLALSANFWERLWQSWKKALLNAARTTPCDDRTILYFRIICERLSRLSICHPGGPGFFMDFLNETGTPLFHHHKLDGDDLCFLKSRSDFLSFLETEPEVFLFRLTDPDRSSPKLHLLWIALNPGRNLEGFLSGSSSHLRHNLFFLSSVILKEKLCKGSYLLDREEQTAVVKTIELMCQLYHHEMVRPDGQPEMFRSGWNQISRKVLEVLAHTVPKNEDVEQVICQLLSLYHTCRDLGNLAEKSDFYRLLEKTGRNPRHPLAKVMNLSLWREVSVEYDKSQRIVERYQPSTSWQHDVLADCHWLRRWICNHFNHFRCETDPENPGNRSFINMVWESMRPGVHHGDRWKILSSASDFYLSGRKPFFHDLRGKVDIKLEQQKDGATSGMPIAFRKVPMPGKW